jgi:hypothetical protein
MKRWIRALERVGRDRWRWAVAWSALALAAFAASGCGVLRNVSAQATRYEEDDELYYASGPDAMVDRLGDPDEWKNRKDGDQLLMTAIWYCVESEYREVTWQSRVSETGTQFWAVIEDIARDCERE